MKKYLFYSHEIFIQPTKNKKNKNHIDTDFNSFHILRLCLICPIGGSITRRETYSSYS